MKKRWKVLAVIFFLATLVIWLEPTRVIWGWLRGEAFYDGRPTSYWRAELSCWQDGWPNFVWIPRHATLGQHVFVKQARIVENKNRIVYPIGEVELIEWAYWSRKPTWIEKVLGAVLPSIKQSASSGPPLLNGDTQA